MGNGQYAQWLGLAVYADGLEEGLGVDGETPDFWPEHLEEGKTAGVDPDERLEAQLLTS